MFAKSLITTTLGVCCILGLSFRAHGFMHFIQFTTSSTLPSGRKTLSLGAKQEAGSPQHHPTVATPKVFPPGFSCAGASDECPLELNPDNVHKVKIMYGDGGEVVEVEMQETECILHAAERAFPDKRIPELSFATMGGKNYVICMEQAHSVLDDKFKQAQLDNSFVLCSDAYVTGDGMNIRLFIPGEYAF